MSQGNSSSSALNSLGVSHKLTIPVGQNLENDNSRTLTPSVGAIAYDSTTNTMYYGGFGTNWVNLGTTGAAGYAANTGSTGTTGGIGNTGMTGMTGLGTTGSTGSMGSTGNTGGIGTTGVTGKDGSASNTGSTGGFGGTGATGLGATGRDGTAFNTGSTGIQGPTGGSQSLVVGSFNSGSTANGAVITGNSISLYSASINNPGAINTGQQSFAGVKIFTNGINPSGGNPVAPTLPIINYFYTIPSTTSFFTGASAGILIEYGFTSIGNFDSGNNYRPIMTITFPRQISFTATATALLVSPINIIPSAFDPHLEVDAPIMTSNGGTNVVGVCRVNTSTITFSPGYALGDSTTLLPYTLGSVVMIPRTTCVFTL